MTDKIEEEHNPNRNTGIYKLVQIDPPESIRDAETIITSVHALICGLDQNAREIDYINSFVLMQIILRSKPNFSNFQLNIIEGLTDFEIELIRYEVELTKDLDELIEDKKISESLRRSIGENVTTFLEDDFEFIKFKKKQLNESI